MEMVLFIGMQAAGKSTFYQQRFFKSHVRLNLDMLRTRNRERILLEACLRAKQPFVVDNTNPTRAEREEYIQAAKGAGFSVTGYYFRSSVAESMARNKERGGKDCVPVPALLSTHKKLELPRRDEGFDDLFYVFIGPDGAFVVEVYRDDL